MSYGHRKFGEDAMKATQVRPVITEEVKTCMICGRPVQGYYGRWGNTGTCSRICENEQSHRVSQAINRVEELLAARRRGELATLKT